MFRFSWAWVLVGCCCVGARADFEFPDFTTEDELLLRGDAQVVQHFLRLTPNREGKVGAIWYEDKLAVEGGFEVTFQFRITGPYNSHGAADGLAFVIQNDSENALGGGGGGMGYSLITNSLAVEIETLFTDHISVQTNGTGPNNTGDGLSLGMSGTIRDLANGAAHLIEIKYVPGSMEVSMNGKRIINASVDLGKTLRLDHGKAWLGFTAATGGAYANHDILNWSYSHGVNSPFRRGDTNGDGDLNIVDAVRILNYLFGTTELDCLDAADANDDGAIEITDAVGLLAFLFLGGFPPPLPVEECGIDPGPDELTCESFPSCL